MSKIPYGILSQQVNKLYEKQFDIGDIKGINEYCEFVREFIQKAGWNVEEYIECLARPLNQLN